MPKTTLANLSGVEETLLIPLCVRAAEAQRPDALLKDEKAVAMVRRMGADPALILTDVAEETRVAVILRILEFDRRTRDFLARYPQAVVVQIGCGLDVRFERVDNGHVEWYDLDLPDVIELRRKLIGGEGEHYHLLACSALDSAWRDTLSVHRRRPVLFLAESVLMYFEEAQVKALLLALLDRLPGAELVCDTFSPFMAWANNLRVTRTKIGAPCHWALKHGKDLESWSDRIRLLDAWFPFSQPEPRLGRTRWASNLPLLARPTGVFHYRLGRSTHDLSNP